MSKSKSRPPTDPAEASRALARSLRKLDKQLARQRREVVELATQITRATAEVAAAKRARPGEPAPVDDALLERLAGAVRASFESLESDADDLHLPELGGEPGQGWEEELHQATSMAWQNAVEASQSLHSVAEQALTQGLSLLFSVADEALTEKQELLLDALTPSSAIPGGGRDELATHDEGRFEDPYGFATEDDDDWD